MISFVSYLLAGVSLAVQLPKMTIDKDSLSFVDSTGRVQVFHGQNIVVKIPPYLPPREPFDVKMSLTDDEIQQL